MWSGLESQLTYCLGIAALAITILIWRAPHFPDRLARFWKSFKIVMRDSKPLASYRVFVLSMLGLLLMIATILMNIIIVSNTAQYSQDLFTFHINRSPVLDVVVQKIEMEELALRLEYLTSQFLGALFILVLEGCWVSLIVIFPEYIEIDKLYENYNHRLDGYLTHLRNISKSVCDMETAGRFFGYVSHSPNVLTKLTPTNLPSEVIDAGSKFEKSTPNSDFKYWSKNVIASRIILDSMQVFIYGYQKA